MRTMYKLTRFNEYMSYAGNYIECTLASFVYKYPSLIDLFDKV